MKTIKTIGIKNLKNQLSAYLKEVKTGTLILITDRGQVIAEMHKPSSEYNTLKNMSIQSDWIEDGKLIPPAIKKTECAPTLIKLKKGTAQNLLDEDRDA